MEVKTIDLNHQPSEFYAEYSDGAGLATWVLPTLDYLRIYDAISYYRLFDHYNHYMIGMWDKPIEWNLKYKEYNNIQFNNNNIVVNIDTEKGNVIDNIILQINSEDTFNQFLNMFKDTDYTIKYCKKFREHYPIEDKVNSCGIEIEIYAPKPAEKRRELIKKVKEHYGNFVYCETETNVDFPIEFTTNVVHLNELENQWSVIEFLVNNGCELGHLDNVHVHISKYFFGETQEEIMNNLHKIFILDYFHGKLEDNIPDFIKQHIDYTDFLCKKYNLKIEDDNFVYDLYNMYMNKTVDTKEDIYPRIDHTKWLRDPDNYHSVEFKWCYLEDKETYLKGIKLLKQYLSVIKYSKEELLRICKLGKFDEIFSC